MASLLLIKNSMMHIHRTQKKINKVCLRCDSKYKDIGPCKYGLCPKCKQATEGIEDEEGFYSEEDWGGSALGTWDLDHL